MIIILIACITQQIACQQENKSEIKHLVWATMKPVKQCKDIRQLGPCHSTWPSQSSRTAAPAHGALSAVTVILAMARVFTLELFLRVAQVRDDHVRDDVDADSREQCRQQVQGQ